MNIVLAPTTEPTGYGGSGAAHPGVVIVVIIVLAVARGWAVGAGIILLLLARRGYRLAVLLSATGGTGSGEIRMEGRQSLHSSLGLMPNGDG